MFVLKFFTFFLTHCTLSFRVASFIIELNRYRIVYFLRLNFLFSITENFPYFS